MNFVSHLKDIQDGLFKRNRFGGCYVYSRLQHDKSYKLGMSESNLFERVKDAKFCFPEKHEFWIHMFIVCHDRNDVRPLEKKLLAESRELKKIDVQTESGIAEQGIRSTEYRITTDRSSLGNAVKTVLGDNRDLWDEVVVFGEKGWVIHKKSIKSLAVSKSRTQHAIQPTKPLKVGDSAYVVYPEKGKPVVSTKAKITKKFKLQWQVHWNDFKGKPFTGKYYFNELYKLKKEANHAIKYWYTEI